jgi:4-hydroxy-4-methyl-2-oxoglutarate aldolase
MNTLRSNAIPVNLKKLGEVKVKLGEVIHLEEICQQFLELPTTSISDAMQGFNSLDPAIKPLDEHVKMAGRALTVKIHAGDNLGVLRAIREAQEGDILVIDGKGYTQRAIAGDFVVSLARNMGIKGIVVDGAVRDILGIKALGFPVFCRATAIIASVKSEKGEINVPVSCGGVSIQPGDLIIGDADGVVAVPQAIEQHVLKTTLDKLEKDLQREKEFGGSKEDALRYLNSILP